MMVWQTWRAEAALALASILVVGIAGCRTPWDVERDYAKRLTPPPIDTEASASRAAENPEVKVGEALRIVATHQLRIYADEDYRSESANWEQELEDLVRRASLVTEGLFGAKLNIESIRRWETRSAKGSLRPPLDSLAQLDGGKDVDWVIGFIGSDPIINASHDQMGMAYVFGRHFVLRGLRGADDVTQIENAFNYISSKERDELIRSRRRHRQTAVFLHEWAHTLGAPHARSPEFINCGQYDRKQERFDEQTTRLIAFGLQHHHRESLSARESQAWGAEVQKVVSSVDPGVWDAKSKEQLQGMAEQLSKSVASSAPASHLPGEDGKRLGRAVDALKQSRYAAGREEISPLLSRYPKEARVQILACQLEIGIGPLKPEAIQQCQTAASVAPHDADTQLTLAEIHLAQKDSASARTSLWKVHEQLASKTTTEAELWAYLANLFTRAFCLTWAEDAIHRAQDPDKEKAMRAWTLQIRRTLGLGPVGVIPPEKEGEFLETMEKLQERVFLDRRKEIQSRISSLRESFPRAPGPHVAQCELYYRGGSLGEAKRSCERALAMDDEAVQAHYILGLAYTALRQPTAAIAHLRRAIELEPGFENYWRALMIAYRSSHNSRELTSLKVKYQQQFSRSAP